MKNSADIYLKSGKNVFIDDFKYITYHSGDKNVKVTSFEDFYLYNRLLTFVGEAIIVTLNSQDIEYIKFSGNFNVK